MFFFGLLVYIFVIWIIVKVFKTHPGLWARLVRALQTGMSVGRALRR